MDDKTLARYEHISDYAGLAMMLFGAVAAFGWLSGVNVFADVGVTQVAAGVGTLCGVLAKWAARKLPPKDIDVGGGK